MIVAKQWIYLFLLGSFMFFRIDCFHKVGLFDENIFMYMEDIDITRRIHKYIKHCFGLMLP